MNNRISVIIPNRNGSSTIGKCLEAAFSANHNNFEIIVVDDCSTDSSVEIIKKFPCKLIRLDKHSGTSRARNTGVQNSSGNILFFIDADCILQKDTLSLADKASSGDKNIIIGGTYTMTPYDDDFFGTFQSIFINYSETKKEEPDYIASHAMIIDKGVFNISGGFSENFLPILEDVEFSHRLRRSGYKLKMNPDILVQHIFNFTLLKSLRNAFRKSMYWTVYSLMNKDLLKDSGTASVELKINVSAFFLNTLLIMLSLYFKDTGLLVPIPLIFSFSLLLNRRLIKSFYKSKGFLFAILATLYYTLVYPIGVGAGSFSGILKYIWSYKIKHRII